MSTCYRFLDLVTREQIERAAPALGLSVHLSDNPKVTSFALTDGEDYMWLDLLEDGKTVYGASRYGKNWGAESMILEPIATAVGFEYLSEYDEGYFDDDETGGEG